MEKIVEKVSDVVSVELVEQKVDEVEKKVEDATDKVLDTVQENTQKVADKVEEAVEKATKPIEDLIKKDARIEAVYVGVTDSIAVQLDGREFSCGCFGWLFALRITRKPRKSVPATPLVTESKLPELPLPREEAKELPPSKTPAESQSESSS